MDNLDTADLAHRFCWGQQLQAFRWKNTCAYAKAPILDVGCGAGKYVYSLADCGFMVYGVDVGIYPEWHGHERIDGNAHFSMADASMLPFSDRTFETVLCFEVLEHCPEPLRVVEELKRVCRGIVLATVPNCASSYSLRAADFVPGHYQDRSHVNFFTQETFGDLLRRGGFHTEKVETFRPLTPELLLLDTYRGIWRFEWLLRCFVKLADRVGVRKPPDGSIFAICR